MELITTNRRCFQLTLALLLGLLMSGAQGNEQRSPLQLYGWDRDTEIVQSGIDRYKKRYFVSVDLKQLDNHNYPDLIEHELIHSEGVDMIYTNPNTAVRFHAAGWISSFKDNLNYESVEADLYTRVRKGMSREGELLGLNQHASARVIPLINRRQYAKLGLSDSDLPKDWPGLYQQIDDLTKQGHQNFYLPHWFNNWYGISWAFIAEVKNRGGEIVDPWSQTVAMELDEGAAYETLKDWARAWKSGAIPRDILKMNEREFIEAFRSGQYAISPQTSSELMLSHNEQQQSLVGDVTVIPRVSRNWGVLDISMYSMIDVYRRDQQYQLNHFFYRFSRGNGPARYRMSQHWLREAGHFSGYRDFMEQPDTQSYLREHLSDDSEAADIMEIFEHAPFPEGIWKTVWSEDFNRFLAAELRRFLRYEAAEPGDVIRRLNTKILNLRSDYGY